MLCLIDSIRHGAPAGQRWLRAVEDAHTLTALLLAAWSLARVMTVHIVEYVLAERACRATSWPRCPVCGVSLRSKGFVKRQVLSLVGPLQWQRRVGRCPQGCATPHVAPLDEALGLRPHQHTSTELRHLSCALAVFVPFATAAMLLRWYSAGWSLARGAGGLQRGRRHKAVRIFSPCTSNERPSRRNT